MRDLDADFRGLVIRDESADFSGLFDWMTNTNPADEDVSAEEAIAEVNTKIKTLEEKQSQVDKLLEAVKNAPYYSELESMKAESRGFFQHYIIPAWNNLMSLIGYSDNTMGALPLIPIAAIAGSAAVVTAAYAVMDVVNQNIEREKRILNDPRIPASVKAQVLSGDSLMTNIKTIGLGVGGLLLLSMLLQRKKS